MAGEDLLEGDDGGANDTADTKGAKKHKPLSKGQKIGAAVGIVTILLVIYQIKKSEAATSTASATASAPIDPQTGYPEGSAEDQAALAAIQSSGGAGSMYSSGGGGWTGDTSSTDTSGLDPSTGATYSSELSTLGTNYTSLETALSALQGDFTSYQGQTAIPTPTVPTPNGTPGPTAPAPTTSPSAVQSANLANLEAELKKDSAGTTAGDKASVKTLNKQIAAVKARS